MSKSIIGGSCHKYNFCRDKRRVLSRQKYACRDKLLLRQTYFCRDKSFVATNICSDKSNSVTKICLSRQIFCRLKHVFVATIIFSYDKHDFVATNVLSRQAYLCRDKCVFVATIMILVAAPASDTRKCLLVPEVEPVGLFFTEL